MRTPSGRVNKKKINLSNIYDVFFIVSLMNIISIFVFGHIFYAEDMNTTNPIFLSILFYILKSQYFLAMLEEFSEDHYSAMNSHPLGQTQLEGSLTFPGETLEHPTQH